MRLVAVALFALGCRGEKSPDGIRHHDALATPAARVAVDAAVVEVVEVETPSGPHITLSLMGRYKDPSFASVDLPAVSDDGTRIAYTRELDDGGRGNPNLALVIRHVDGRGLDAVVILAPEPRWHPDQETLVRHRIAEANRRLVQGWKPMKRPGETSDANTLDIDGLIVRLRGSRLEIARGRAVLARKNVEPARECAATPQLRTAAASRRVVLVEVGFAGDGCWREAERYVFRI